MDSKITYQTELFSNRISKKYKTLRKWARKNRVTCYRLYDRDIPEIPLAVDLYEFLPNDITNKFDASRFIADERALESANSIPSIKARSDRQYIQLYLYERPYDKPEEEEKVWLLSMAETCASIFSIPKNHIIIKYKKRDKGGSQYSKDNEKKLPRPIDGNGNELSTVKGIVQECGALFSINLTDYIDTGLFLDHRPLRNIIRNSANKMSVLNLFCYTSSFSVYAAEGNASRIESVDLSNTYLSWSKNNLELNDFMDTNKYITTRADAIGFLKQKNAEVPKTNADGKIDGTNRFNIIILDPPTFSNSKKTDNTLDINQDWKELVNNCLNILIPGGVLYFSTNSRRLSFKEDEIIKITKSNKAVMIQDITDETLDEDFKSSKAHRCWKLTIAK